jgi:hypothetical protein
VGIAIGGDSNSVCTPAALVEIIVTLYGAKLTVKSGWQFICRQPQPTYLYRRQIRWQR